MKIQIVSSNKICIFNQNTNNFAMFKAPLLQTSMFFSTETMTYVKRGVIFGIYSSGPKQSKKKQGIRPMETTVIGFRSLQFRDRDIVII